MKRHRWDLGRWMLGAYVQPCRRCKLERVRLDPQKHGHSGYLFGRPPEGPYRPGYRPCRGAQ